MSDPKDRVVFFTTDAGYLVPTIVAALQAAAQPEVTEIADILILLIGFDDAQRSALASEFPALEFRSMDPADFELPDDAVFNQTHVPRSALARLSSAKYIDPQYKHVVYLDGDIQILRSIKALVSHTVDQGCLLAAPDAAEIWWRESGKSATMERAYVESLRIMRPQRYFNSGILAATRSTWQLATARALRFVREQSALCRYHDQSALNAVTKEVAREYLSPRFNFNRWFGLLGLRDVMEPAIIHFSGAQKPWADKYPAYAGEFKEVYLSTVRNHPVLEPYWELTSGRAGKDLDVPPRLGLGWKLPWRVPLRRWRALRQFQTTKFHVA